jgi:hypothetical protein
VGNKVEPKSSERFQRRKNKTGRINNTEKKRKRQ